MTRAMEQYRYSTSKVNNKRLQVIYKYLYLIQLLYSFGSNMQIFIQGGGIAGLTLALTASKYGYKPILIQQRDSVYKASFGGGIGLWPPSQMVMERLGVLKQLENVGYYMPNACYYNSDGYILGHPSKSFGKKFPVLCLERQQLSKYLYYKCQQEGVKILTNQSIQTISSTKQNVVIKLGNGQKMTGKVLIGADGIGSKVRNWIMSDSGLPNVVPYHCQYAYFRAVVDISHDNSSEWHKHAFENWGQKKRFGYVPLKAPKTFWFVAIPIGQSGLEKVTGSHCCTQQDKKWIIKQFQFWQAPINIKRLIQLTPSSTILRTDICKIKDVTSFPWNSNHKNIIILGDAANATAPNLAQGAGLAIESAWDLISMVNFQNMKGLQLYMEKRKRRASTVQNLADLVAKTGQLPHPLNKIRNFAMKNATFYLPKIQQRIFEEVVSYSLGGNSSKLYWMPQNIPKRIFHQNMKQENCLLARLMGPQFNKLSSNTKKFRASLIAFGNGRVNVQRLFIGGLLGLPKNMTNAPFHAISETFYNKDGSFYQKWTRVFKKGQKDAKKYSTYHYLTPNLSFQNGFVLTQTLGVRPDIFRFGYLPFINKTLYYESKGLWINNYKLPIPQFLLPSSQWTQKQTKDGWQFQGKICLPKILGSINLMKYSGQFTPQVISRQIKPKNKKVIIAGGTGMIGSNLAKKFHLSGWDVQILSRSSQKKNKLPFAFFHQWNPQNYYSPIQISRIEQILEGADIIINLSGQNPGAGFWTQKFKNKILQSRLNSIKLISSAIKKLKGKLPVYLQASAAGIYGNRHEQILSDEVSPGKQQTFRIRTCKQIQDLTRQGFKEFSILRIGHVFSSEGGLFPSLELASIFRARKFGGGGQYVPWVYISDLSDSIVYISENYDKFKQKTVNISSPNHLKYEQILSSLAKVRGRRGCIVPVPQMLLKLFLGQVSSVLFDSQRMHPKLLIQNGFKFKHSDIQYALTSQECL